MGRFSAQLLLSIAASMSLTGCLIPPDGKGAELLGPYPPQVDRTKVFPKKPKLRFNARAVMPCTSITLEVEDIVDLDSEQLRFRWVANNDIENTFLYTEELSDGTHLASQRIFLREAFASFFDVPEDQPIVGTGIMSLFITDAPAWADPDPQLEGGEDADLGMIAPDPSGTNGFSVVEVRWTFEFGFQGLEVCGD